MDAEDQLESFIGKFSDSVAAQAREALARMRRRLPGAVIAVYDNYNALAIGFGTGERVGDMVFSLAVYPRWVSLFFGQGARLDDPHGLLRGAGSRVRHIVLTPVDQLDDPRVVELMARAMAHAPQLADPATPGRMIIKSISPNQRPRRPA